MTDPSPYTTELCSLCDQPWADHVRMARTDAISEMDDDDWLEATDEEGALVEAVVTMAHCIWLLKRANEGPSGPPGPMGMMGADGRDAPGADNTINHGFMTRAEFDEWVATRREK